MQHRDMRADCDHCVGLCCVALAFSRADGFGHDKMAGDPCHHLTADSRCSIHARREQLGYDGCEEFDCLGAGQRATAVFATQNWRRDPAIARALQSRFRLLTKLQEMRLALIEADDLELTGDIEGDRLVLLERLADLADGHAESIDDAAAGVLVESRDYLRRLAQATGH